MAITSTLSINSWSLQALNPDDTDNAFMSVAGTVPTNEIVDWAGMGQKFRLVLTCEIGGTYADGSTADLDRTVIRYNPAMFLEPYAAAFPVNTYPAGGYTYQVLSVSPATYAMRLAFVDGEYLNSNYNGTVTLEVLDDSNFIITHEFRMTADAENYLIGSLLPNFFRLTKASVFSPNQQDNSRPSVYGYDKALNVVLATRNNFRDLFAENLSIGFRASFNNYDSDRNLILERTVFMARESDLLTEVDSLSAFEDTYVKLSWDDPSALITLEEAIVIFTKGVQTATSPNVGTYERDLELMEAKLLTTGSTAVIDGAIRGPVAYTQAAGVTTVSFYIDHEALTWSQDYDLHSLVMYGSGPSDQAMLHSVLKTDSQSESLNFNFGFSSEFWSRNGNHAQNFGATVMERLVNVLTIDTFEYFDNAAEPYFSFFNDVSYIRCELIQTDGTLLFSSMITHSEITQDAENTDNFINTYYDSLTGELIIATDAFRVPYENFQGLPDLGGQDFIWIWKVRMVASGDDTYETEYQFWNNLSIRQYENDDDAPSGAPKVSNVRFIDPATGLPISDWCDLTEVLVLADVEDLGVDTYVNAFVDPFPLGADFTNDFALQEEDPAGHVLPDYVVIPELESELISDLEPIPVDGVASFLLDVTNISGPDKIRVSVMAYRA